MIQLSVQQVSTSQFELFCLRKQQSIELVSLGRENKRYYYAKRLLDIILVILALPLLCPLFLLIALFIKLDSAGPIFFVQERAGTRKRCRAEQVVWQPETFSIYKFRSMVHNADQSVHQAYIKAFVEGDLAANHAEGKPKFKLVGDPRVTRIGRLLRKTSLDELPQLFNVLKGEMSLVGPRPVPRYEADLYREEHYERLMALPGLTGLWQVKGRGEVTFDEMMALDIEYIRNRSLGLDIWILLMTLPSIVFGRGGQ